MGIVSGMMIPFALFRASLRKKVVTALLVMGLLGEASNDEARPGPAR